MFQGVGGRQAVGLEPLSAVLGHPFFIIAGYVIEDW